MSGKISDAKVEEFVTQMRLYVETLAKRYEWGKVIDSEAGRPTYKTRVTDACYWYHFSEMDDDKKWSYGYLCVTSGANQNEFMVDVVIQHETGQVLVDIDHTSDSGRAWLAQHTSSVSDSVSEVFLGSADTYGLERISWDKRSKVGLRFDEAFRTVSSNARRYLGEPSRTSGF